MFHQIAPTKVLPDELCVSSILEVISPQRGDAEDGAGDLKRVSGTICKLRV